MPSHRCHEEIGSLMGIEESIVRSANLLIDDPDRWFSERGLQNVYGLRHDDDRKFAMTIVRSILRDLYGDRGILAADLHYCLDYIDHWLDPKLSRWMLRKIKEKDLYPSKRWGFVHRYKRIWYPSFREGAIPITAYCSVCRGINKPINSPFCSECRVSVEEEDLRELSFDVFLQAFAKKIEEREIDLRVIDFVRNNFNRIVTMIIMDREERGLDFVR